MPRKTAAPPRVVHVKRPDLGEGELGEVVKGAPPVAQVYWPEIDKYGYYLVTDLRRLGPGPTELAPDELNPVSS